MEPEGSSPHSQVPATTPFPEPDQFSHYPHSPLPEDQLYYYPHIYARVFQVVSFPQVSSLKPCTHLSRPPTCYMPAHLILLDFIILMIFGEQYSLSKPTAVTKTYPSRELHIHNLTSCSSSTEEIVTVLSDTLLQGVPLATEPGIYLIILSLMRILQLNLRRIYLIVQEMWRHNNMC